MSCLPSNVKTFIDILFLASTLTNFLCGKMVLSFAFKTFLTINHTVSYSFHVVSLTIDTIIYFLSLPVALISFSYVSLSTFNVSYFSIFCDWILLCSAALHRSMHCVRVKSGSLWRISPIFLSCFPFIICNLIISSSVMLFHSQSLELDFKFN